VEEKYDNQDPQLWEENIEEECYFFGVKIYQTSLKYKATDHERPKHTTKGKVGY
jgi:hypothetical protein